jgi:tartrate-resistant acid phosphatase type 5
LRKGILLFVWGLAAACTAGQETQVASPPPGGFVARTEAADVCGALRSGAARPAIKPANRAVRVLAFGDFGSGAADQRRVAAGMRRYDAEHPFDFGITLGDNFYPQGLPSPTDERWIRRWEDPYGPLGIRVYATLGNHDHRDPASPGAQIQRSALSRSWCLPRHFYTYTAGPVQLFALDTDPIEKGEASLQIQLDWLKQALQESQAPWKVVYGHHPIYTNGEHGGDLGYLPPLRDLLLPILIRQKVDVYLAGHDHDLQALKPDGGVSFFVSGGGGRETRPLQTSQCRAWAEGTYGFAVLEATAEELTVRFVGPDGQSLYETSLKKGSPPPDCARERQVKDVSYVVF